MTEQRSRLVVGLIGEIGAGKDTFVNQLDDALVRSSGLTVRQMSTSFLLRQTLGLFNLEESRENLQKLPVVIEREFGKGTLARAMERPIRECSAKIVVYNSIRWSADVELIQKFDNHLIVYITADQSTRWRRTVARKEKAGEGGMTFADFKKAERRATEIQIPSLGSLYPHYTIRNDLSEVEFRYRVRCFAREKIEPML